LGDGLGDATGDALNVLLSRYDVRQNTHFVLPCQLRFTRFFGLGSLILGRYHASTFFLTGLFIS
jgi:hypothetical protein